MAFRGDIDGHQLLTIVGKQPSCIDRASAHWLHVNERKQFAQINLAERRLTWLQGRLALKQLVLAVEPQCGLPADLEIVSKQASQDLGCAPRLLVAGQLSKWRLSLSHTAHHFAACLAIEDSLVAGIDLVEHADLSPSQLCFWLRDDEQQQLAKLPDDDDVIRGALARLWSGKEAAFKTLPDATAFQPQCVEVNGWDREATAATWRTTDNRFTGMLRWDALLDLTLATAIRRL